MQLQVMKRLHCLLRSSRSTAMGRPSRAAKGQPAGRGE